MNIVLTGMMGTGKNLVGRELAALAGMEYINTDDIVEKRAGCTISEIFEKQGEAAFRKMEKEAVEHVSSLRNHVISTGGGVVKDSSNMELLEQEALVVCLKADAETIYRRTHKDSGRPLLEVDEPMEKIRKLLAEREAFYSRCDLSIETADKDPGQIARMIADHVWSIREQEC